MTTETPFTVADLRRWATRYRNFAKSGFNKYGSGEIYLAQAAAFDALADARELCENRKEGSHGPHTITLELMDRILRGEKPK